MASSPGFDERAFLGGESTGSTHAVTSCGVGNTVGGFVNRENIRVSEVYSYTETTEEDKALSALYKLRFLSQPSSAPFLGPNYTNHQ